ncbi:MAG: hypothetical protein ACLRSW_02185 [Christensenellaceae bacterium]
MSATISAHKGPRTRARFPRWSFADFDAASLKADVSVSEVAETLPSAEELPFIRRATPPNWRKISARCLKSREN